MCAQYTIRQAQKRIAEILRAFKIDPGVADDYPSVRPYQKGPVLRLQSNDLVLSELQFSLLPRWSKEPRVKFATHNARFDTIDEKPTFKDALVKRHCVVPMTGFVEPIYENELAGNMVCFSKVDGHVLFAAAIWESWLSKESGEEIDSFAIITHEPIPFVLKTGHDRSPLFLSPKGVEAWLGSEGDGAAEQKKLLLKFQDEPKLEVAIDRPMRAGWEKRRK
jgi:putative SOS response-associated peptidase YedK